MKRTLGRDDTYYAATLARDARFDGKFFVGVKTTGIYCRPICPAKPKRENVEFFRTSRAAVKAGYRACRRCRPEVAPSSAAWSGTSALVRRASRALRDAGDHIENEDRFAAGFGVSARHLRRLFSAEIGRTPKQLADEHRLRLARTLVKETKLPLARVAHAAGFKSIRRFNAAFAKRFGRAPTASRRGPPAESNELTLPLAYRPPFHFAHLLAHYHVHRLGELEVSDQTTFKRLIEFDGRCGWVSVRDDPERARLLVGIDFPDVAQIPIILARVRVMFDLDVDPLVVAHGLGVSPKFKRLLARHPGLRVPSGWDPFEMAIATILGQLVSVEHAQKLTAALIDGLGRDSGLRPGRPLRLFPRPADIAASDLKMLGTTGARKRTLIEFSRRVAAGELALDATQDVEKFERDLLAIPGIGPWTAAYVAMKVLRDPDAFPESDLILARALELHPRHELEKMRPWRAYAAILLWREYAQTLKKGKTGAARSR